MSTIVLVQMNMYLLQAEIHICLGFKSIKT